MSDSNTPPTFAFCHDAPGSGTVRATVFDRHRDHVMSGLASLKFAAPLAARDGVEMADYGAMEASVFAIDLPATGARAMMAADPYFVSGAWDVIDIYTAPGQFGSWSPDAKTQLASIADRLPASEIIPALPEGRNYAILCRLNEGMEPSDEVREGHSRHSGRHFKRLLMATKLEHDSTLGSSPDQAKWDVIFLYRAADLAEATAFIDNEPLTAAGRWAERKVLAIPGAAGAWLSLG